MKKPICFLFFLIIALNASAQYWQQQADYTIDVTLNEQEKTLDGFERIIYYNNSPDTLFYIWFHLWPNAYRNDRTAFSDQLLENGRTAFYFSNQEERGYINRLDFKVDGRTARTEDHPQHIDIVKLVLPSPLPPQQKTVITTPFHVKLPFNFSRGGYDGNTFQVTQWYPKPAVYDRKGWHPMPYLDQGEFYSEFGNYDVRITVPGDYVVASTGTMQNKEEKEWMNTVNRDSLPRSTTKNKLPSSAIKKETRAGVKTLNFKQDRVHDFAWFANRDFIVDTDTMQLPSGRVIEVQAFYTSAGREHWKHAIPFTKQAIRFYSAELGDYPYAQVSVVEGPESFGGGMEYPTITIIAPVSSNMELDVVIAHEVGHNWFQGILATNEREFPWMDEGLNTYYERKYTEHVYGDGGDAEELYFQTIAQRKTDQPVMTRSEELTETNYGLVSYHKTAAWMQWLEKKYGREKVQAAMRHYYSGWQFRHPYPEDFFASFRSILGNSFDSAVLLAGQKGILPGNAPEGFSVRSPLIKGSIRDYIKKPTKNTIWIAPAIGGNKYDKILAGAIITNYGLPPTRFNFLLIPLYGTGSKKAAGLGKLNYSIGSEGRIRKADIFLNGSLFSMDDITDPGGKKHYLRFSKLVPGFKLSFSNKHPRSHVNAFMQWKSFFITETSLRVRRDTVINGTDTIPFLRYLFPDNSRWLNQLRFVYENNRVLYPYSFELKVEQSKDFIRPALESHYYFNYREGGLQLRVFAGKFFYRGERTMKKQFANDRYYLNMTGANGYEDYTYSDYFIGRNEFEGLLSQQIMIRDGGFKVRTDLLASKIGRTDNWLAAVNFNTTIPKKFNPLSVLPVKIPLRLFLDIGTYAEAWEKDAEGDRFLYDFGFHIPLFREAVNLYFPIMYNKEFSDYIKSTIPRNRFFKTMSFTVNLYNRDVKRINRELEF